MTGTRRLFSAAVLVVGLLAALSCGGGAKFTDSCGNELDGRESTVFGVDAATGEIRWQVRVPQTSVALRRHDDSHVVAPTDAAEHATVLDTRDGTIVDTPEAGPTGVTVDVKTGTITADGQDQPLSVAFQDLSIQPDSLTSHAELHLQSWSADSPQVWSTTLAPDDGWGRVSRPLVFGDLVVISVGDRHAEDRMSA